MEMEELSNQKMPQNDLVDYPVVMAKVKGFLFEQMVLHSQAGIGKNYLKKCLEKNSASTSFVNQVLKSLANTIKKQNLPLDFVGYNLDLIKLVNMDQTDGKIFERLHQHLSFLLLEKAKD